MRLAIILPARNEAENIGWVIKKIREVVSKTLDEYDKFSIIVVDDGSTDPTSEIAKGAGAIVIRHSKNRGKGRAKRIGWKWAIENGFDWVLNMDGDGQHSPKDIPKFVEAARGNKADIILPSRKFDPKVMPFWRRTANLWQSLAVSVRTGKRIQDSQCDFRMIKREVLEKVKTKRARFEEEIEFLINASRHRFKFDFVPVETIYFKKKSTINPVIDTIRYLSLLIESLTWG